MSLPPPETAHAALHIDLAALAENYHFMCACSGTAQCGAALKADAYGMGMDKVAPILYDAGCRIFFVALPQEGVRLRALLPDSDIYILNGLAGSCADFYAAHKLRPCLASLAQIKQWTDFCAQHNPAPAALFIDSGFNRLGLGEEDLFTLYNDKSYFARWRPDLIMSHLACADQADHPMNRAQLERFRTACAMLPDAPASLANSEGVFLGDAYHFSLTRCGISLFGGILHKKIKPVAHVYAPIIATRMITQGETVGYGADFTAQHDMHIAIIALGYADGLLRTAGNAAPFAQLYCQNQYAPIIGRISMDLTAIDITHLAQKPDIGDRVEIFGAHNHISTFAHSLNTIPYELLTRLGNRFQRMYNTP